MNIEQVSIAVLVGNSKNARTHSKQQLEQIANSIREFGFTNPILIDQENVVIAGHGRLMAAPIAGLSQVPCIRLSHLTEKQKRAYMIADNKIGLNSSWDIDLLTREMLALAEDGFDTSLTGFLDTEIDSLLNDLDSAANNTHLPSGQMPPYLPPQAPQANVEGPIVQSVYQPPVAGYTPNYTPEASSNKVSEDDIKAAQNKLDNQYSNTTSGYLVVNCPECFHEFKVKA